VVGWTGFAIGGAGLLVGAATGVLAFSKKGTVDGECPDRQCPASAQPDINASKAFGNVSNVAFIVAGAGAAVGALTLLFGHESRPAAAASIEPWVGPGSAGVRGSF
jgi:hypothetical protein